MCVSSSRKGILLACLAVLLSGPLLRGADFIEPRQLNDVDPKRVIQTTVGVDIAYNAYVAWTRGEEMHISLIGIQGSRDRVLSAPGSETGDPSLAINHFGATFVAFTQYDPASEAREIFLTNNVGGSFQAEPLNLSRSPGDEYAPRICLDSFASPHLVWARRLGNRVDVFYCPPGEDFKTQADPVLVAGGDYPALTIDPRGTAHFLYSRDRDLFYRRGISGTELQVTSTPDSDEYFPSIAVTDSSAVFLAYEEGGSLYYRQSLDGGESFEPALLLDSDGVTNPEFRIQGNHLSIVYEKEGNIYFRWGPTGGNLLFPVRVTDTEEVETSPSLAIDARGSLHVSFIREGNVFYTNNTGDLKPDFTAVPVTGEAPLRVQFQDLSDGNIEAYSWDFGDGTGSNNFEPTHVYSDPGKYTVSLEVFGTGTSARTEKVDLILVQSPSNRMWIPDNVVFRGQQSVWVPVLLKNKDAIQALEILGTFDPAVFQLNRITWSKTALEKVEPEFFQPTFSNDPSDAFFYAGAIFEWEAPWVGKELPSSDRTPKDSYRVMHLIFDVLPDAPLGPTRMELRNDIGPAGVNEIVVQGRSILPALYPSTVTVINSQQISFLRGDADMNRSVDLTDAIMSLNYMFLGAARPVCLDALDSDDSGSLDIADVIYLLAYMFQGGEQPPIPFPGIGLDPTRDDNLDCGSF